MVRIFTGNTPISPTHTISLLYSQHETTAAHSDGVWSAEMEIVDIVITILRILLS